jgi:hypothetical protein
MPRRKKKAHQMTSDELAKRIFPKKVADKLKEIARPEKPKTESESSSQEKNNR